MPETSTYPDVSVSGPFEIPDISVDAWCDEDDVWHLAHVRDMSRWRRLIFETRHAPCGQVHSITIEIHLDLITVLPEMQDRIMDEGRKAVIRAVEACDA